MSSNYNPGIPTGTLKLNQDYQNIQNNFQQLDTTFGTDHTTVSLNTAENGFHRNIRMIPNSTTTTNAPNNQPVTAPSAVTGIGQLFSAVINDGINTDNALYFLTGANRLMQLTRNFAPTIAKTGSTFLAGGLILKWGTNVTLSATGTVTFANAFPAACFLVHCVPYCIAPSPQSPATVLPQATDSNGTLSTTGFSWRFSGQQTSTVSPFASVTPGFFWIALGN